VAGVEESRGQLPQSSKLRGWLAPKREPLGHEGPMSLSEMVSTRLDCSSDPFARCLMTMGSISVTFSVGNPSTLMRKPDSPVVLVIPTSKVSLAPSGGRSARTRPCAKLTLRYWRALVRG
jgi:hypothetical protein